MVFLQGYNNRGKGTYLGCGILAAAFSAGVYFLMNKNENISTFKDPEPIISKKSENLREFAGLVQNYETYDKSNGIVRGISNKRIEDIIESWRELPRNDRLGVLKQILQEESKEFLYSIGASNEGNAGTLSLVLFGGANQ